jgi:hypothetical protein
MGYHLYKVQYSPPYIFNSLSTYLRDFEKPWKQEE